MSNSPKPYKRVLSVQVTRETYYQLKQEAAEHKMKFSSWLRAVLNESVIDVVLTEENQRMLDKEIEDARKHKA